MYNEVAFELDVRRIRSEHVVNFFKNLPIPDRPLSALFHGVELWQNTIFYYLGEIDIHRADEYSIETKKVIYALFDHPNAWECCPDPRHASPVSTPTPPSSDDEGSEIDPWMHAQVGGAVKCQHPIAADDALYDPPSPTL